MATEVQTTAGRLTEFQQHVLAALGDIEQSGNHEHHIPHGQAIRQKLETAGYYGEEINHGQLYQNLSTLVDRDYVEKSEIDGRTNGFELTAQGKEYLVETGERILGAVPEADA